MIFSADEFVRLRSSDDPAQARRASVEEAELDVWLEVVASYPAMRRWVAHNKTVPAGVLKGLAIDEDPAVRWAVAARGSLPGGILELLATDPDESVRVRVARNRRVATEILSALKDDRIAVVRRAAEDVLRSRGLG